MEIEGFGTLVHPDELKWIETPGGNALKVMRVSAETGSWTALFRSAKGTTNPPHIHLGPADFYVLSGVPEIDSIARIVSWTVLGCGVGFGIGRRQPCRPRLDRRRPSECAPDLIRPRPPCRGRPS